MTLSPRLREGAIVALLSALASLAFCWQLFAAWDRWGSRDWDQHFFYHEVPRKTVLEYGQIPLWNPYYCGGTVMLGNPQSRCFAPTFPLILMAGTVPGLKIEIFVHLAIGLVGAYALGRRFGLGPVVAWVPAFTFMLSGMYAHIVASGMTWGFSLSWVPFVLLFHLRSFERPRELWITAAALALLYLEGGAYVLAITAVFLGVHAAAEAALQRRLRPLLVTAGAGAAALALMAIKALPSIEYLRAHPRRITDFSGLSLHGLAVGLLDARADFGAAPLDPSNQSWLSGADYAGEENAMFIGVIPVLLALLAMVVDFRRMRSLLAGLFVCLWLAFGDRVPWSLWELLHRLPVYDSMRVSNRFRIPALLVLALLAGVGLAWLVARIEERFGARIARAAGLVTAFVVLLSLIGGNGAVLGTAFAKEPMRVERAPEFRQTLLFAEPESRGARFMIAASLYPAAMAGIGLVEAEETMTVPRLATPHESRDYSGEVYLRETRGTARYAQWTPNRLRIEVSAPDSDLLVVNQNFDAGWRSRDGRPVLREPGGLLAVRVGPQDREIELIYRPPSFLAGAALTAASALLGAFFLLRRRRSAPLRQ